jgi:hypothetical protein
MTNETVANIAVTVTAAMLATAAVAFTLSGNAPTDPAAGDLPVISVTEATPQASNEPPTVQAAAPAVVAEVPATAGTPAPRSSSPESTKPKTGTKPTTKSVTTVAAAGVAAATVPGGDNASRDSEHEVVHPRVHETDAHGHHSLDPQIEED